MTREYHPRDGRKLDPKQCRASVYSEGRFYQSCNKSKVDGWCGTHSPAAGARRKAKAKAADDALRKMLDARRAERDHAQACVNALAGLDPSKLAALLAACKRWCDGPIDEFDVLLIRTAYLDLKGDE